MKSPFKFLDSYTHEDRAVFFGRDREVERLRAQGSGHRARGMRYRVWASS